MYIFRTKETHELYEEHKKDGHLERGCPLCATEAIEQFKYWKIITNKFPYDRVSEVHHMMVPNRHVTEYELTKEEKAELLEIKHAYINDTYIFMLEAMQRHKSIPAHFHLHLIIPKEEI
jgi:diadenosine tetraphosphate (Ap4A) HIT family hydrolase